MLRYRTIVLGPLIAVGFAMTAYAAPLQVDHASISQATLEDFEGRTLGDLNLPVSFTGFTYSRTGEAKIVDAGECNGRSGGRCLWQRGTDSVFVFDGLAPTAFGFDLFSERGLIATVSGNSGSATFDLSGGGVFGFYDPLGLLSVSLSENQTGSSLTATQGHNNSNGPSTGLLNARPGSPLPHRPRPSINWGITFIDNVTTGPPVAPIPLPATAPLFLAGLGGLAALRGFAVLRRRAGQAHS